MVVSLGSLIAASPQSPAGEVIDRYCVTCHNERLRTGGLVLAGLDVNQAPGDAAVGEKVGRKLNTNAMPPPGLPQPNPEARRDLIALLERQLDRAAEANPN